MSTQDRTAPRRVTPLVRRTRGFVGRATELACLAAAYEAVLGGHCVTVLVGGDAGIGKSRLIEEFLDVARLRDATVAVGLCVPGDGALPYAPVVGILRDLSVIAPTADELLGFAGGDAQDPPDGRTTAPQVDAGYGKTAFFESILQLLVQIAQTQPVVLAIQDVHWCDSASAQLLDYLIRNLGNSPVLFICSYRSEELGSEHSLAGWLAELGRGPRVVNLALAGLDRRELAMMLSEAAGTQVSGDLVDSVWARSQGNPFYAEELWSAGPVEPLPAALQTLILIRVRRLTARCQQLLGVAATIGAACDHELLAAVLGSDADAMDADLAEAIDGGVLVASPDGCAYSFRHALLREAVYSTLLPARRKALHKHIATALQRDSSLGARSPSYRTSMLANHFWAAEDWAAVITPAIEAGDAAASVFAFREAELQIGRAMTALARLDAAGVAVDVDRQALLERASEYASYAGAHERAVELARAAVQRARDAGDVNGEARCQLLLARSAWGVGDSTLALDSSRAAVELQPSDPPTELLAVALAEDARSFMMMGRFPAGAVRARQAIEVAEAVGADAVTAHARCTLGSCVGSEGQVEEGIELIRSALEVAEEVMQPELLNRVYANLSDLLVRADRLEEAAAIVFDAQAMGEEIGGVRLSSAASNAVGPLIRLGRWTEAEAMLDWLGIAPFGACAAGPFVGRAPIAIARGTLTEAAELIETAHELSDNLDDVQTSALVLDLHAQLEIERGRHQEAVDLARRAVRLTADSEDESFMPQCCATGIRASADRRDAARGAVSGDAESAERDAQEFIESLAAALARRAARGATLPPYSTALTVLCNAELTRFGQSDAQLWRQAADGFEASPDAYLSAYCRWREAEALLEARGSRARAAECLSEAVQLSRALRTSPLTARIEELAARTRIELHEVESPGPAAPSSAAAELGLTPREREILGKLTAGCSDKEIAETLFISKKTVRVHVTNVLRKLQVANRVEAGKIGHQLGLRGTRV